jgi:hypothetical protein
MIIVILLMHVLNLWFFVSYSKTIFGISVLVASYLFQITSCVQKDIEFSGKSYILAIAILFSLLITWLFDKFFYKTLMVPTFIAYDMLLGAGVLLIVVLYLRIKNEFNRKIFL